jgi:outer membrane protein TolC
MKRSSLLLLFIFCSKAFLGAQDADTSQVPQNVLPIDTFVKLVVEHHPVAVQARLLRETARAENLKASGAFDPKLFSDISQKQFDDKDYFTLQNSGVEIPGWFGLKGKAGYELNEGLFLNNQNTVPGSGLWYADVSLTLLQGLFMDERRAAVKQANLLRESAEFEVQLALNDLLQEALVSYWDWYSSYAELLIFEEAVELADFRFRAVKRAALVGDEPMIDTLEAAIQLQDRQLKLQKARADFITKRNMLQTFLWLEGQIPLQISAATVPRFEQPQLLQVIDPNWFEDHPWLQVYQLKLDRLDVERRLNAELLKPQLDLSYKFINQPTQNDFFAEYSPQNYQWAVSASFPLFVRKGRGELLKTKVKIQETDLELDLKRIELQNKVQALEQELILTGEQLLQTRQMVNNYSRLLQAEITKFRNGESSLFLVNSREVKYLESRQKEVELESKVNQVWAKLKAAAAELI